jgi:hypothetical protein
VATGSLTAVLVVAGSGFAIGRTTAGEGDHPDRPGHGQRFDHGPGGQMMPPGGMPGRMPGAPGAPGVPDEEQAPDDSPSTGESEDS